MKGVNVGIGLIGPGLIGSTFLDQVARQKDVLNSTLGVGLRLLGIANSSRMLISEDIDMQESCKLDAFAPRLMKGATDQLVIVDCTSSDSVPDMYSTWLSAGCHVITPNKKLVSGPWERYTSVLNARKKNSSHFFYESTVGAGLPVISSLRSLLDTGDRVHKIYGVFSGTLSYIFNNLSVLESFSKVVRDAKSNGFTEPDPREDLSGLDVARKVIVLARECGLKMELDDLNVQNLVPEELLTMSSVEIFMDNLPKLDVTTMQQVKEAAEEGCVLRYVGIVDVENGKSEVALRRYPSNHPLAQLSGTENMICFETQRYNEHPLIVRGPGAGAEVTAMGIFSDLVTMSKQLPEGAQNSYYE